MVYVSSNLRACLSKIETVQGDRKEDHKEVVIMKHSYIKLFPLSCYNSIQFYFYST